MVTVTIEFRRISVLTHGVLNVICDDDYWIGGIENFLIANPNMLMSSTNITRNSIVSAALHCQEDF